MRFMAFKISYGIDDLFLIGDWHSMMMEIKVQFTKINMNIYAYLLTIYLLIIVFILQLFP